MHASDAETHRVLDRIVSDGGTWYVSLSTTVPALVGGVWTNVTEPTLTRVALPRNGGTTWAAASGRSVQPLASVPFASAAASFVPVARVFFTAATGGTVARVASLTDVTVTVGSTFNLPPASCAIEDPI